MVDALIASLDDVPRFDADGLVAAVHSQWPSMQWSPASGEIPELGAGEFTIEVDAQWVTVEFLPGRTGLGVEGHDDLASEVVAWLTGHVAMPEGQVVILNWGDDVVPLRENMPVEELRRLHTYGR